MFFYRFHIMYEKSCLFYFYINGYFLFSFILPSIFKDLDRKNKLNKKFALDEILL